MPPINVAIPIGINTFFELMFASLATAINAGISITTIGVLLIKALKKAPNIRTPRKDNCGCFTQDLDSKETNGLKEPLISIAFPTASKAQIVTKASFPKLFKNSETGSLGNSLSCNGNK